MNKKKMLAKLPNSLILGGLSNSFEDYNWSKLTTNEEKKCKERFETYKPEGCSKISRREI